MIIIGGMPGTGKRRYTRLVSDALATLVFYEADNTNPVLQKFYEDPIAYGLASQTYFISNRFKTMREACGYPRNVVDRSIYEDLLFAQVNHELGRISEQEKMVYDVLANQLIEVFEQDIMQGKKSLFVYLKTDFDTVAQNLTMTFLSDAHREEVIEYYRALHLRYEDWMRKYYTDSEFLSINVATYDLNNTEDRTEVRELILTHVQALGL